MCISVLTRIFIRRRRQIRNQKTLQTTMLFTSFPLKVLFFTRVPVCCWSPCSGAQIPASCVLACYWSMAVCYWGSSQSQTTTQLAGIWAPLHGDQQHTGTLVIYGILELCQQTSENGMTPCDYWTYFPSISECFMLESCSLNDNPEAFSGERNCPPGRYLIRILLLVFFVHFPFFSFELPRKRCILHTEL